MENNKLLTNTLLLIALTALLAGCGHSKFDKGVSGADANVISGLATSPSNVNLGKPIWLQDQSRALYKPVSQSSRTVANVQ